MLQLYRRHVKSCRFWTGKSTNGNRRDHNCRCPVWVDGYLAGVRVNKTLDLRDWTRANEIVRDWEIAGSIQKKAHAGTPVGEACDAFMADAEAQRLSESSLKKYRVLLINQHGPEERKKFSPSLLQFCAEAGLQFTTQIALPELTPTAAQMLRAGFGPGWSLSIRIWNGGVSFRLPRPHRQGGETRQPPPQALRLRPTRRCRWIQHRAASGGWLWCGSPLCRSCSGLQSASS